MKRLKSCLGKDCSFNYYSEEQAPAKKSISLKKTKSNCKESFTIPCWRLLDICKKLRNRINRHFRSGVLTENGVDLVLLHVSNLITFPRITQGVWLVCWNFTTISTSNFRWMWSNILCCFQVSPLDIKMLQIMVVMPRVIPVAPNMTRTGGAFSSWTIQLGNPIFKRSMRMMMKLGDGRWWCENKLNLILK